LVGAHLIDNGVQMLHQIIKFVKLSPKQICDSLAVLIHHNVCKFDNEEKLMKSLQSKEENKEYEEIK
jgi:hypothetical protein